MMLVQHADQQVQNATAQFDPSLGRTSSREKSGRAITALQDQSSLDSSDFLHNFAAAIEYEAKVILDLAPYVYDTPGRIVQILDGEGQPEAVMLNAPYYQHPETGQPVAAPPAPQAPPVDPKTGRPVQVKHYELRKGTYSVAVSVGRARQTLRQEALDAFDGIFQAMPDLIPILGPLKFQIDDFPKHEEVADLLRKVRAKMHPELEDNPQDPTALQAQLAGMKQQLDQLGQAHQQAVEEIKTKRAEQDAKIQTAKIQSDTQLQLQAMRDAAQIEVARITAAKESLDARMAALEEQMALQSQQAHEAALQAQDHAHTMQQQAAGADQAMAQQQDQQAASAAQAAQAAAQGPAGPAAAPGGP